MKKDLKSFRTHNSQYVSNDDLYETTLEVVKKYNDENMFKKLGFELALKLLNTLPETHIDIGSGTGWLLLKTSPLFNNVIAIEPSESAIEASKKINKEANNINYRTEDMIDFVNNYKFDKPVFMTTATVLSHMKDYYVKNFLKEVNDKLPIDSVIYFDERYDKNLQLPLWHIRNKTWWINNLPDFQLIFLNIENSGYASGILGFKMSKHNLLIQHKNSLMEKILWKINYIFSLLNRIFMKMKRLIKIKSI